MKTEKLYKLIWMSRPLMQSAEAVVERGLKSVRLTVRTRAVLEVLLAAKQASVPDIAEKLEINRQYVQLMVNETLSEGLTLELENPRHKGSTLIALSQKGHALIEDVVQREMMAIKSVRIGLNDTDIETALRVVTILTQNLKTELGND